jgi:Transcriptional regulatory protein, C terminal
MIYNKPKQFLSIQLEYWTCLIFTLSCNLLWSTASEPNPDKINLALRRTADQLLRIACDSTSQIPSIVRTKDGIWQIRLEQNFDYDSLPSILQASLSIHHIDLAYDVLVKKCDDGTIALGYNHLDFLQKGNVACGGRKRSEECQFIEVSFIPLTLKTTTTLSNSLWLFLIAAGFLGIWLYKRTPTADPSLITNTNTESETLGWTPIGNSKFDLANQVLICGGSKQALTFREAKLLSLFVTNINKVLDREYIIQQVWADEGVLVGRSVDVFVSRLRKKMADDDSLSLNVVHGVGYRLECSLVHS